MGIAHYLIASTVLLVIAQRLVRQCCTQCRGIGCPACQAGFSGRTGVYECLPMSDTLEQLVLAQAPLSQFKAFQTEKGYHTLREAAQLKIATGVTTDAEILRVLS